MLARNLRDAYERTRYMADIPGGKIIIRCGQPSKQVDKLLAEQGQTTWAYVTAWNPGSVKQTADVNNQRHEELKTAVAEGGWTAYEGSGVGASVHMAEVSLLILGIAKDDALSLGRKFDQLAIVCGEAGGAAELVEC